ncbi:MAG: DNA polymerase III subunit delta, partial [Deltaproteobacteria bacterium RBG_13_52_11b]
MAKQQADIHPVYFFYGPEDYLIDEEVQRLLGQTLSQKERELSFHLFNGAEASLREVVQTARTMPMFSRFRVVVLKDADLIDKKESETLLEYVRDPSPTTCLVLCGQTPGLWARHLGDIEKIGRVREYRRLRGKSLVSWLVKRMAEMGKRLSEDAAEYIVEVSGDHLQDLDTTLEKVFLGVGEKKDIDLPEVDGFVSEVRVSTVFDLMDAIGNQDLEK